MKVLWGQTHKYTNTVWSNLQIDPTSAIFFHRKLYQDIKNNIPKCLTCKYTKTQIHKNTNTNTQIQFELNLQISLTCAIFLKRKWYQDLNKERCQKQKTGLCGKNSQTEGGGLTQTHSIFFTAFSNSGAYKMA